jgi:hypothetical protein
MPALFPIPIFLVTDCLQGRSLDADFCAGDRYCHSHFWQNPPPLRPRSHLPNDEDRSSEIVSVRQVFSLSSETWNFANYNLVLIKFLFS